MSDFTYTQNPREVTYADIKAYALKEVKGRGNGTYTSLGGAVVIKIEDAPDGALVSFKYYHSSWQFTYTNAELGRKETPLICIIDECACPDKQTVMERIKTFCTNHPMKLRRGYAEREASNG